MSRTNAGLVREVIETDESIPLSAALRASFALVNWLVTKDSDGVLTDELLVEIETYLAAHFYAQRDPQYTSKNTGKAGGSFQGQTGMYLESTWWGQQAISLDVSGNLAARNAESKSGQKTVASATWLGTRHKNDESERAQDQ